MFNVKIYVNDLFLALPPYKPVGPMLCFWKGKGTEAFSPGLRAPYEEIVIFFMNILGALGGMEAIASVASLKYQTWPNITISLSLMSVHVGLWFKIVWCSQIKVIQV